MKNSAIKAMLVSQFDWDHRDIDIEFLACINGEYEFMCRYVPQDNRIWPRKLVIKMRVEEQ